MHGDNWRELTLVFIFSIILLSSNSIFASHIIGGDITYTFLRFNESKTEVTYEVKLALFRDPLGIDFDNTTRFGIFKQTNNGRWESYTVVHNIPKDETLEYNPQDDQCKTRFLSEDRLEYTNYTFELTLEITDEDYMIAYQKCCRNHTINNVLGDGDLGAVYDVIITSESMRLGNSSPKFGPIPPIFVCAGYDLNIDHSARDIDGDSLVYRFCKPFYPGIDDGTGDNRNCCGCSNPDPSICTPSFPTLDYEPGFNPQNPMGGDPQVTIDSHTGFISGTPELIGAYVVVVCVDEYREGRLIGTVRRDFELNSIVCSEYLDAEVASDIYYEDPETGHTIAYFESCEDARFSIVNLSRDEQYIKDYIWEIYDRDNDLVFTRSGPASRSVTLDLPGPGNYSGFMILNDNASCSDTAFLEFDVWPEVVLDFSFDYDQCTRSPIEFRNESTERSMLKDWLWEFGDGNISSESDPYHSYQNDGSYQVKLTATDEQGCIFSYAEHITYEVLPKNNTSLAQEICHGESFLFGGNELENPGIYQENLKDINGCDSMVTLRLTVLKDSYYRYTDTICLGDEQLFIEKLITEPGEYRDTLINKNGCDSIISLDLHVAQNLTKLDLTSPLEVDYGSTITLVPIVGGEELIYKQWSNTEQVLSNALILTYLVEKDEWLFFESRTELFCLARDSALVRSNIVKGVYVPSIFSPNGDGNNDTFIIGTTRSIKLASTKIFDRWGNIVFSQVGDLKTLSVNSWDGTFNGEEADIGVYVYLIEVEFVDDSKSLIQGNLQLIR